jgi:hypothetical protein
VIRQKARHERQKMMSIMRWASAFLPLAISTRKVAAPCWACRDSSVCTLEISVEKVMSPVRAASAASARNCKLVKPDSTAKVSITAVSVADRVIIMSSNR